MRKTVTLVPHPPYPGLLDNVWPALPILVYNTWHSIESGRRGIRVNFQQVKYLIADSYMKLKWVSIIFVTDCHKIGKSGWK